MNSPIGQLQVSAPGRICLFGEHQDYLNLPVIACAISLRLSVTGHPNDDKTIYLDLPDIGAVEQLPHGKNLPYQKERDYFRSALNVLHRKGLHFSQGCECSVRGEIPINAGTSSSSALVVAWIKFLAQISDERPDFSPEEIAEFAHQAEVVEFSEPGGMMDQYTSALGRIIFLEFAPSVRAQRLHANLGNFVLGDSGEPKETKLILARVKHGVIEILNQLARSDAGFSLRLINNERMAELQNKLTSEKYDLLAGTWRNHQITLAAKAALRHGNIDRTRVGQLLNEHQAILRDTLKISTAKIDRMIDAALSAGALGAKINGSGGGGCMFAYAPNNPHEVAAAIERVGGKSFVVQVDEGVRIETAVNNGMGQ